MGKISNTLSILTLLSSGRKYTTKELAKIIEVTPRQIRIYIEELEKAGIYVEVIKGRYGGYYYQTNDYDYKLSFDINEVNTLEKIYLSLKNQINDDKLFDRLGLIIEKMRFIVLYSNSKQKNVSQKDNKIMYNLLSNAIYNNQEVTLVVNKNKKIQERKFIPHSIYVNNNIFYVTGYCCNIKDIRTYPFFEIDKINV